MVQIVVLAVGGLLVAWLFMAWLYRNELLRLWLEPVLKYPVMIFESDDWGPAPEDHASVLRDIASILQTYVDSRGVHPVMTLGVVLAAPNAERIIMKEYSEYFRVTLRDPQFQKIRQAMLEGQEAGVFALQLHGMEHFWPPTLLALGSTNSEIAHWLTSKDFPNTEELPAHVQSRWVATTSLPSSQLDDHKIEKAVHEEVEEYKKNFGVFPIVAVPPTFVWTESVEQFWVEAGIKCIVTPGRRYTQRDENGAPGGLDRRIFNGMKTAWDAVYLVRDDYFEPVFGHSPARGVEAVQKKFRLRRPALLETHRVNFIADEATTKNALASLESVIRSVLDQLPNVRFMTTSQLADAYRQQNSELFEHRFSKKISALLRRATAATRVLRPARFSGLAAFLAFLQTALDKFSGSERTLPSERHG